MRKSWTRTSPHRYWLVAGVAAVAVAVVWTLSASATSGSTTITLHEVSIPKNDRAFGGFTFDRPPVPGDEFVSKNAEFERGARVGHSEILHTFITGFGPKVTHKGTILFVAQVFLRGGTLLVQGYGRVDPKGPSRFTLPVVGGTGAYSGARGYLEVSKVSDSNTTLVFRLQP
jgi:hypothetical protein